MTVEVMALVVGLVLLLSIAALLGMCYLQLKSLSYNVFKAVPEIERTLWRVGSEVSSEIRAEKRRGFSSSNVR